MNACNIQSQFYLLLPDDTNVQVDFEATQQISAAFHFDIVNGKIDAKPPNPEILDFPSAYDLYDELKQKVDGLIVRLIRVQADEYVVHGVRRLAAVLSGPIQDCRPGLILSRMRTLESIRYAFDNPEGHEATFPDFRAAIDDVWLSGQDLLATFPEVRRIERERLAMDIERTPDTMAEIQTQIEQIQTAASNNEIVAPGAVSALTANKPDMSRSRSADEKANLIGDTLLITRNFVSESIRAIAKTGGNSAGQVWDTLGDEFTAGAKQAARMLPPLAVIALLVAIAGPVGGIAGLIRGDVFRSVSSAASKVIELNRSKRRSD